MKKISKIKKGLAAENPDDIDVFYMAVSQKQYEIADRMLNDGLEIDKTNLLFNPLGMSASEGNVDAIKYLLSKGVDVNYPDSCGIKALSRATHKKHYEAAKELLKSGAKPNTNDGQYCDTSFFSAVESDLPEFVNLLFDYGLKIDKSPEMYGLALAAKNRKKEMCELLLNLGFPVEIKNIPSKGSHAYATIWHSPLGYTAINNDVETCKLLLSKGANPDFKPENSMKSPVELAVDSESFDVAVLLLNTNKAGRSREQIAELFSLATKKNSNSKLAKEVININSHVLNENEKIIYWQYLTRLENYDLLDFLIEKKFVLEGELLSKFDLYTRSATPSYYSLKAANFARRLLCLSELVL